MYLPTVFLTHAGKISEHKESLEAHLSTYVDSLDSSLCHRVKTCINLLAELHKHSQPLSEDDSPGLPLTLIYAVLCDLKAVEWRALQDCHPNSEEHTQEVLQQVQKRRKAAVSFTSLTASSTNGSNDTSSSSSSTSFTVPPADQKLLDSLQQHQNQFELSILSDRVEHLLADMVRNEASFELFEWEVLVDTATHAGEALVIV